MMTERTQPQHEEESGYPTIRVIREGRVLIVDTTPVEGHDGKKYYKLMETTDPENIKGGRVSKEVFDAYLMRREAPNPEAEARKVFVPTEVGTQAVAYSTQRPEDALGRCIPRSELLRQLAEEQRRQWGPSAELPPEVALGGSQPGSAIDTVPAGIMGPGLQPHTEHTAVAPDNHELVVAALAKVKDSIQDASDRAGYIDPAVGTRGVVHAIDTVRRMPNLPEDISQKLDQIKAILDKVSNGGRIRNVSMHDYRTAFAEALRLL